MKTALGNFYTYPKGAAKQGPDEVCSLIRLKIQKMSPAIKELNMFNDPCGGQNRNNTLVRVCLDFDIALIKIYQ